MSVVMCFRCGHCHEGRCGRVEILEPAPSSPPLSPVPAPRLHAIESDLVGADPTTASLLVPIGTQARLESGGGVTEAVFQGTRALMLPSGRVIDREQVLPAPSSRHQFTTRAQVISMWRMGIWPMKLVAQTAGVSEREAWRLIGVTDRRLERQRSWAADRLELVQGRAIVREDSQRAREEWRQRREFERTRMFCRTCNVFQETKDSCHAEVIRRAGSIITSHGRVERACSACERQLWAGAVAMHSRIPSEAAPHLNGHEHRLEVAICSETTRRYSEWFYTPRLTLTIRCLCGCGLTVILSQKQHAGRSFGGTREIIDPAGSCIFLPAPKRRVHVVHRAPARI